MLGGNPVDVDSRYLRTTSATTGSPIAIGASQVLRNCRRDDVAEAMCQSRREVTVISACPTSKGDLELGFMCPGFPEPGTGILTPDALALMRG